MDNAAGNPFLIVVFCVIRCLVPVVILLGFSYLLRRFGFIAKPSPPPSDYYEQENDNEEGGLAHG